MNFNKVHQNVNLISRHLCTDFLNVPLPLNGESRRETRIVSCTFVLSFSRVYRKSNFLLLSLPSSLKSLSVVPSDSLGKEKSRPAEKNFFRFA